MMISQIKVLVEPERVVDLIAEVMDIDGVEVEIEANDVPDESIEHPPYSAPLNDITTVLIAIPAIITSLTGLAKVILDYKLKAAQNQSKLKKTTKEPSIVVDNQVIPLSKFSTAEELSRFLIEKTKRTEN